MAAYATDTAATSVGPEAFSSTSAEEPSESRAVHAEGHAEQEDAPPPRAPLWMENLDGTGLRVDGLDFYALLGVEPLADTEELRRGYREQARLWHPDKAGREYTQRFQVLAEAHAVLADPHQRAVYDSLLSHFPGTRLTASELHPTGFQDVQPFQASLGDLRAVATFHHAGELWAPAALGDVAWQRPERNPSCVRVSFCGSYARRLPIKHGERGNAMARGQVHDSVTTHLATLLVAGGWRDTTGPMWGDEAEEANQCPTGVVVRHCVLGVVDTSEFYERLRDRWHSEEEAAGVAVRFALESTADALRKFFRIARERARRKSLIPDGCAFA